jgi:hypothetical protein
LRETRADDAVVPHIVGVLDLTGQHPGDDLHVAVRMGAEALRRRDPIVVVDDQQAMPRVPLVTVRTETETVPGVEPSDVGVPPGRGTANLDGGGR